YASSTPTAPPEIYPLSLHDALPILILLHHVDEPGGLGVAEPEPPLQERDRRGPLRDHQVDRVPVDVVPVLTAPAVARLLGGQLHVLVHRRALRAQELADRLHLLVGDPGAVHAHLT